MAKNIIFCADGTWNGPEDASGESVLESDDVAEELTSTAVTNVVKLYANLCGTTLADSVALKNEDEKVLTDANGEVLQVAKYLHGVGDSTNPLVKFMGGVFGVGVVTRIVRGYTFISRYYRPGDQIHICGFSRGAYTARALAGVITQVGLLNPQTYDPNSKMQAYRLGIAAWARSKTLQLEGVGRFTPLADDIVGTIEHLLAAPLSVNSLIPNIPLASVAVWDTVGSMGIPEYVQGARSDILRFVDTSLSGQVKRGIHAMSIDELRADFPVTKWDQRDGVTQVWFAGAHADVGGGYPATESSLSDLALQWMMGQLDASGVRLSGQLAYKGDSSGALSQAIHTPWTTPPFDHLAKKPRAVAGTDDFHPIIRQRWDAASPIYRPPALGGVWQVPAVPGQ